MKNKKRGEPLRYLAGNTDALHGISKYICASCESYFKEI